MKTRSLIFLFSLLGLLSAQAQITKTQAKYSVDSLLPSSASIRISEVRKALEKALNYAESGLSGKYGMFSISQIRAFGASNVSANSNVVITDTGKEGLFQRVVGSVASDNTGTVLVTSNGERYHRVNYDFVKPEWFGALGNNSTNDLSAISAALVVASSQNKPLLLDANYAISDELTINVPVSITGKGKIRQITFNKNVIKIQNTTDVTITNIKIEGNNSASVGTFEQNCGISVSNVNNLKLENLEIFNCNSNGIFLKNAKNYSILRNHLHENKYIYDTAGDILAYSYESNNEKGQYGIIKENRCYSANSQGISLIGDAEFDIDVSNNIIVTHQNSVEVTGAFFSGENKRRHGINYSYGGSVAGRYKIAFNTIRKTGSTGIYGNAGAGTGINRSVIIIGNEIDSVGLNDWDGSIKGGLLFFGLGKGDIISNNRVSNVPRRAGIAVTQAYWTPEQSGLFSDNVVKNCIVGYQVAQKSTNVKFVNCSAYDSNKASFELNFYLENQNHNVELVGCYGKNANNGKSDSSTLFIDAGLGTNTRIKIKDCIFEGLGKTAGGYAIDISSVSQKTVILEGNIIRNFSRGINYNQPISGRWPIPMAKNMTFENCTRGAYYYADNNSTTGLFDSCRFINCDVDSNSGNEIWMNGSGWMAVHKGTFLGENIDIQATSVPTSGSFIVGDKVWKKNPASGQPVGWVCVSVSPLTFAVISTLP